MRRSYTLHVPTAQIPNGRREAQEGGSKFAKTKGKGGERKVPELSPLSSSGTEHPISREES